MSYILLICYFAALYVFGYSILQFFPFTFSKCMMRVSRVGIGIITGVPVTYLLSCLVRFSQQPILYGVVTFIGISAVLAVLNTKNGATKKSARTSASGYLEAIVLVIAALVGYWIMWKSTRLGINGEWLVASNTVFDTAHALSLIRSFSWGNTIPYRSPFAAGFPDMYHFMFYFFVAIMEKTGIPLVHAFNMLGALGFALYLMGGFYFAYMIAGKNKIVGVTTMALLLTHSTLTWVFVLFREGLTPSIAEKLWRLPNYIFAGPYDGSIISLFFTLNVFVNQRHLGFAIAGGLFLIVMTHELFKKEKISKWVYGLMGAIIGSLFLWNFVIAITTMCLVILMGIVEKKYRQLLPTLCGFVFVGAMSLLPFAPALQNVLTESIKGNGNTHAQFSLIHLLRSQAVYWGLNLGFGLIASVIGWKYLHNEQKKVFLPFLCLFFAMVVGSVFGRDEISQKVLNFWNVGFVSLCAYGVVKLWSGGIYRRIITILLFVAMTVSGVIDIMVIKNDFAYPAVTGEMNNRIEHLRLVIPPDAVVLSYKEMFHEVALSGRKQYDGFFASPDAAGRQAEEQAIFKAKTKEELQDALDKTTITYLYVPKKSTADFPYVLDMELYRSALKNVFEDEGYILFDVQSPVIQ